MNRLVIQIGIWTGQKWIPKTGKGPQVKVSYFRFDRGEVTFEYLTGMEHPRDTMDLTSFLLRHQLVSNG